MAKVFRKKEILENSNSKESEITAATVPLITDLSSQEASAALVLELNEDRKQGPLLR